MTMGGEGLLLLGGEFTEEDGEFILNIILVFVLLDLFLTSLGLVTLLWLLFSLLVVVADWLVAPLPVSLLPLMTITVVDTLVLDESSLLKD